MSDTREQATFGGGCFWCTEAMFRELRGVKSVVAGYAGGDTQSPTYQEVSSGNTGHAEVVQITFDPSEISYEDLLEVFFATHDPTISNQQGADVGSQYRSLILYHTDKQKELAQTAKKNLEESKRWPRPIVTEIVPLKKFFPAEQYHQKYYENNRVAPYCQVVIEPKLEKFRKQFQDKIYPT
ncbi:MAG: peptide-methionine (S)-S-oxide reductase MsrA [Parcubacteria group bacterium]|nr:peptide-methionine (S)-S-oxide reductase MsrA [Parcubacteria group bacterium]